MSLTIVPSIDLRGGRVVRLKQGDYERQVNYDVDPQKTAAAFRDAGAQWLHIVDLDGAKDGRPVQTQLIEQIIKSSGLKTQAGGGVRSTEDVDRLLDAGASRVVIGTKAIEDWPWFTSLAHDPIYADKLVLALDAKKGVVATHGWTQSSQRRAVHLAANVTDWPLAGILYTDVATDGMMQGPSLEQTRFVAEATRVPVIASGGVGNISHIEWLTQLGVWGVIVGRSLYEGTLDLADAIRVARAAGRSQAQ
jgi:phosphoribosylformimino-5-aminoimidazole carboxamide ribotide isomerase